MKDKIQFQMEEIIHIGADVNLYTSCKERVRIFFRVNGRLAYQDMYINSELVVSIKENKEVEIEDSFYQHICNNCYNLGLELLEAESRKP